jgi:N utilization substance protein A
MKGSRVQSIIKELRGEKIDIIEWSDEPSVFAANALSPAKVSQVRITDINGREMEVIVSEDQLSLAIGKKGQNVRLATRLVGWDINIVSEDVLKKEIAQQMGRMMASGEAVPITALEGVSASQAESLSEKGVTDVEALAAMTLDDLVDTLDVSLDEAQSILSAAGAIVEAKNAQAETAEPETAPEETQAAEEVSAEPEQVEAGQSQVAEAGQEVTGAEPTATEKPVDENEQPEEPITEARDEATSAPVETEVGPE